MCVTREPTTPLVCPPKVLLPTTPPKNLHGSPKRATHARGMFLRESLSKVAAAAAAATLDSDSLRKIPREKFRTEINTPRARGIVRVGGRGVHGFGGV